MVARRGLQMKFWTHILGAMTLALLTALAGTAVPAGTAVAQTRTISNVATIEWELGTQRMQLPSNRVDLVVTGPGAVGPISIYRFQGGGEERLMLEGTACVSTSGDVPFRLDGAWAGASLDPAQVVDTDNIQAGEPIVLVLDLPSLNRDSRARERATITVQTRDGDRERITLVETDVESGRFAGAIATVAGTPPGVSGDCRLTVTRGGTLALGKVEGDGTPATPSWSEVDVLVDPFGIAFDSANGEPVPGVRVSIVEADTGRPADVFGDDGVSRFPSTVVTGSTVTDSGGNAYAFPPGDYRFPLMRPGRYRLLVEPPSPYLAPSTVAPADLAGLRRPDGAPFAISAASFGGIVVLSDPAPVRVDIPIDKPTAPLVLTKSGSTAVAERGDVIQYRIVIRNPSATQATGALTVTDVIPAQLRFRLGTMKLDGSTAVDPQIVGRTLTLALPALVARGTATLTYLLEVRPDASAGDALNRAEVSDSRGTRSNVADALVRISRETIADRMTIVGRILDGGCGAVAARGIAGVRIMLEDGSYTVTDADGRYHFEGVKPGTHVVQLDDMTLPADRAAVDCARNTRSGGRAFSRFVEGQGGALKRVDFHAVEAAAREKKPAAAAVRAPALSDPAAAGAERDWLTGQQPGIAWLFPEPEHNPRAPVVRVAIKHAPGQTIRLFADGRPVDAIAFDGTRKNGDGSVAVSLWRGLPLEKRATQLTAEVRDAGGAVVETLTRTVHYSSSPLQAELVRERSVLIADGVTRPVIALRLTDRDGRPVHHGLVGDF